MPDNSDRAAWAESAVEAFMRVCGTDREDAIGDMICNLCHLAEADGDDAIATIRSGMAAFYAETHHERLATVTITITPEEGTRPKPARERLADVIANLADKRANFPADSEYIDLWQIATGQTVSAENPGGESP